jgi:aminoglycoside-2''-adenylyltransferase
MTTAIDNFLADGFVAVRRAVPPGVVRTCAALIEDELCARGIDPRNRVTWTKSVVRFPCPEGPAFGDDTGRQIDFHVIVFDERGRGVYGPPGTEDHYPAEALTGKGTLNGRAVDCITPEWLARFHTGYPVGDKG